VKPLVRALKYLKTYWLAATGAFVSLLISTGARLFIPRLTQQIIDEGISDGSPQLIIRGAVIMIVLALAGAIFTFLQGLLSAKTAQGVAYDLRNGLYEKIQSLSFSYHDRAQTGQLLTRATSDVERIHQFVGIGFLQFLSAIFMMLGSITFLFIISWQLALLMLILVPLTLGLFAYFAGRARPLFKEIQQRLADLNTILQENLVGIRVVKAFAREPYETTRYEKANENVYDLNIQVGRLLSTAIPLIFAISNVAILAIYWLGGYQVIGGDLTIGRLVAFANYMTMAFFPMLMLGMAMAMMPQAQASAERVFEILDAESEVKEKPEAVHLPQVVGRVAFNDVSFRYFDGSQLVLKDINLVAEPGETIALLGATGSGKSTVVALIPRFYDVSEGSVTIDGIDVQDVKLESLRRQIGIVFQETTLFSGTIRANIAFGDPAATEEEIIEAAKAAEAHDFIMEFADGYDTHVGERGVTLSGGQKQRVAVARALLLDPRILILDDATSNVDYETEARIQRALERLMEDRTSFIIAQRVATARDADRILVLEEGRIAARGSHEELIEESPLYAEIYCSQLENGGHPNTEKTCATPQKEISNV